MMKKICVIMFIPLLFTSISYGQVAKLSNSNHKKYYQSDFGQQLVFTMFCSVLGAAGGAGLWYVKFSKKLNDNVDDYYNNIENYQNYDSLEAWLAERENEKKQAKKELGEWIIGGAIVGALFGVIIYPESSRTSMINFSAGEKPQLRVPKVQFNWNRNRITVPIIEYTFK